MKYSNKKYLNYIFITFLAAFVFINLKTEVKAINNSKNEWEKIPSLTMKLRNGTGVFTVGITDVNKYHNGGDDLCLGLASGFRACQIAFASLYPVENPIHGDILVISGTYRACPADAITYITGARYGKGSEGAFNGNYIFDRNIGEFNFIFVSISTGKAVKLVSKYKTPKEFDELRIKSKTNSEIKEKFTQMSDNLVRKILIAPAGEIFEAIPLPKFEWKDYKEKYMKGEK